jgi:hypothetical protein
MTNTNQQQCRQQFEPGRLYRVLKEIFFLQEKYNEYRPEFEPGHQTEAKINDIIMFIKTSQTQYDFFVLNGKTVCNRRWRLLEEGFISPI